MLRSCAACPHDASSTPHAICCAGHALRQRARCATASMLRVDGRSPHRRNRAPGTTCELRSASSGSASSLHSRAAAPKHCWPSFSMTDAAAETAAAAVLDVDRQLQRQLCQASGGMAADSSEAVAACAAHLRWTEAAAKRRPKHAPMSKNVSWKHMVATCFRLVTRTPTRSGSVRPRAAQGIP